MRHHKPHCRAGSSRTFIATSLLIRAPHARSFKDSSGVTNAILAIYDRRPAYQDCCANTGPFCRLHRASHPGLRINTRSANARRSISAEITLRRTVSSLHPYRPIEDPHGSSILWHRNHSFKLLPVAADRLFGPAFARILLCAPHLRGSAPRCGIG